MAISLTVSGGALVQLEEVVGQAGDVAIDDDTVVPSDLFASFMHAGDHARARGQHELQIAADGSAFLRRRDDVAKCSPAISKWSASVSRLPALDGAPVLPTLLTAVRATPAKRPGQIACAPTRAATTSWAPSWVISVMLHVVDSAAVIAGAPGLTSSAMGGHLVVFSPDAEDLV